MNLRDFRKNIIWSAGNIVLYFLINLLCSTLKVKVRNKGAINGLEKAGQNYILAFWHGTMLLPWYIHRNKSYSALVSKSKDGELLAKILNKWKYAVQRGSSSKDGKEALSQLVENLRNNKCILITPDGPRGPRMEMKAGAVVAAKKSGVPLILAGVAFKSKWSLKSWDKFEVPKFFSEAQIIYSNTLIIDENLSYEETSAMITKSGERLKSLQKDAELFN